MASLLKSGVIVSAMTFLSRILGLARDVIVANLLGASASADVYLVAQKIPNFLRRLFAEGAFSQAFIPVLSEYQAMKNKDSVLQLIGAVSGTLGVVLFGITVIGVLGSSGIAAVFGPGFLLNDQPEKYLLASALIQITFPYIFFISLTAFCGSVLNSINRFAVPAFSPVLLNVCLIIAAIWIAPLMEQSVFALAWAIFVAGILQLLMHLPFMWKEGLLVKPTWGWKDAGVRKILRLMAPAMFGVSVTQINLLLDTIIASFLITSSISWLYYSDRMLEFPLGIFGIAIATVILPSLSRKFAKGDSESSHALMNWALHMVFLIGLPAAIGLFLLAEPIMLAIFQHGAFTQEDAYQSSLSLKAYTLGLLSFMFIKVLATSFFSRQDTKTPVKIGIIAMIANMIFNLSLYQFLGHVGLATATAMSATLNAGLLLSLLVKKQHLILSLSWFKWIARASVAAVAMTLVLLYFMPESSSWQQWSIFERVSQLTILIVASASVYVMTLFMFGFRISEFKGEAVNISPSDGSHESKKESSK